MKILKESKIDISQQDFVKLVAYSKMTICDEEKDGNLTNIELTLK